MRQRKQTGKARLLRLFALLSIFNASCIISWASPEDDAKRPYEIVWAGRTADENGPPLASLTDPAGWTVECTNAAATIERATDRLLFGDGVTRLNYRAEGDGKPVVTMKPPTPLAIKSAFDTVSCWIYGNNVFYRNDPSTPPTVIEANFTDSDGKPFSVDLARIHHLEWCIFQKRLPPELAKRVEKGGAFTGLSVTRGTNREFRSLDFCSLCVFKEKLGPLSFRPRARRGVQIFPDQPQGANTGPGKLPFPNVETTVVPVVPEDKDIEFRFPKNPGSWDDLAFRYRKGPWISLAKGGGIWPRQAAASAKTRFRRIGNSVVADIEAPGGNVEKITFGGADVGEDANIVPVPYYNYRNQGVANRPCVISASVGGEQLFISATVDWTQSSGSIPFAAKQENDGTIAANGGVEYVPKTDGRRNDAYERFVWTVSTDFAETLPVVPNPPSPWKHITGTVAWSAYGASERNRDSKHWKNVHRKGIRHLVVTDHETGWRDANESFTFRTRPAPKKGGDKGQYDYARFMIDKLGFIYGPYNQFTDLAPVNEYWATDHISRKADGNIMSAWARCYSPKPLYAVEMCEKLTPEIQRKFRFKTAYCDVHTCVTPWGRTDYDARSPGAASFAQTFYAYGEIMLIQKKCWGGPVYSEGSCHWMYCGLTDGNYAQDQEYQLAENPWIVDFDLLRLHPLCCNFGAGSTSMFYKRGCEPKEKWALIDPFAACTVAFGHPPFLLYNQNAVYGYFMLQALAARYTQADAESIRYADADGTFHSTSHAVASGDYRRSQIAVRYSDGTVTVVNGSRDGDWLAVRHGKGKIVLPPYGFFGMSKDVCSFNGTRDGARIAFARGPEYSYLCARERKWTETPFGGTDGELVRLFESGGTEEVIPFGAKKIMLPYAAAKVVGLDAEDAKETGPVPFTVDDKGRTLIEARKDAYSYRVTPPADWREPDAAAYAAEALSAADAPVPKATAALPPLPMPYVMRQGMVMRGTDNEVPVDSQATGARILWASMANEGVSRPTLSFHPPYKGGKTGYVFARYRVNVPDGGVTFTAKIAKSIGSTPGDGILFRALVRESGESAAACAAESVVTDYAWHDFRADLSRWAGRKVDLILVGDPGRADNTYGDSGGWAEMHLERPQTR